MLITSKRQMLCRGIVFLKKMSTAPVVWSNFIFNIREDSNRLSLKIKVGGLLYKIFSKPYGLVATNTRLKILINMFKSMA